MENKIELFGERTANCFRVAIALEEVDLPYETTHVSLRHREQKSEAYIALNPAGKVPTIVDRQLGSAPFVLAQSNAIVFHLDDRVPGILFPRESKARAIAFERYFYFLTECIGHEMASFIMHGDNKAREQLISAAISTWLEGERFLHDSKFMAGDTFSAADIAAATFILFYQRHIDWSATPKLRGWFETVVARPSFERGLAAFDG